MDILTILPHVQLVQFSPPLGWSPQSQEQLSKYSKAGSVSAVLVQSQSHMAFLTILMYFISDPLRSEISGNNSWCQNQGHFYRKKKFSHSSASSYNYYLSLSSSTNTSATYTVSAWPVLKQAKLTIPHHLNTHPLLLSPQSMDTFFNLNKTKGILKLRPAQRNPAQFHKYRSKKKEYQHITKTGKKKLHQDRQHRGSRPRNAMGYSWEVCRSVCCFCKVWVPSEVYSPYSLCCYQAVYLPHCS